MANINTFTGSNATVTLINAIGPLGQPIEVTYDLGITEFMTSSLMQMQSSQVLNGKVHIPVRRSEQSVQFSVEWPLQAMMTAHSTISGQYDYNGFKMMNQFHNDIRRHHQLTVNALRPAPMKFVYNNSSANNKLVGENIPFKSSNPWNGPIPVNNVLRPIAIQGWIQTVGKQYDRFQNVYPQQYLMNVLSPLADTIANYSSISKVPYIIPTSNDVLQSGLNWTSKVTANNTTGIDVQKIPGL